MAHSGRRHRKGVSDIGIERVDKYRIRIDGCEVPANEQQEAAIRNMTSQQRRNFLAILGHTDPEGIRP